jgi:RNA polymerase sigma-70 factor (ECF subfamily)
VLKPLDSPASPGPSRAAPLDEGVFAPLGEEAAPLSEEDISRLHALHRPALLRYVRGLLRGDAHRAEDIVQETLLRAWLNSANEPPGWEPGRAWLRTVARNLVIDHGRREGHRTSGQHMDSLESKPAPSDELGQLIQRRFLVQALSQLSRPHREILVYTYLLDRTGPETAQALGIPQGTVKSRVHHAMRALRQNHPTEAAAA